jgi:hypothetical protein
MAFTARQDCQVQELFELQRPDNQCIVVYAIIKISGPEPQQGLACMALRVMALFCGAKQEQTGHGFLDHRNGSPIQGTRRCPEHRAWTS